MPLICLGSGHEFDCVSEAGFDDLTISVARTDAEAKAQNFGLELPSGASAPTVIDLSLGGMTAELFARKSVAFSDNEADTVSLEYEEELLLALMLAISNAKHRLDDNTDGNRDRVYRRALELIEAQADDPPNTRDLCVICGTSWPTLHRAFVDRVGISPKPYLTALRLNKARQDLLSGKVRRVADAANAWGFWHMASLPKKTKNFSGACPLRTLGTRSPGHSGAFADQCDCGKAKVHRPFGLPSKITRTLCSDGRQECNSPLVC